MGHTDRDIPRLLPGEVVREALLTEMEECKEEVVVIRAGKGCGKTTVLAQLARRQAEKYECIWTDEGDMRGTYHRILSFLLSCNEKTEMQKKYFCLFVNDLEHIEDQAIWNDIERLTECGKGRVRIYISIRKALPPFLARPLIQGKIRVFDDTKLMFEQWETGKFLANLTGRELPDGFAKWVQEYTGGWPAGVALVGHGLKGGTLVKGQSVAFDRTLLYNYISYEIFCRLSCDVQTFLTESVLLEELDPSLCDYVLDRSDSRQMIVMLSQELSVFMRKVEGKEKPVYLPVFAEFLQERTDPARRIEILDCISQYELCNRERQQADIRLWVRCLGSFDVIGENGNILWRTKKTRELFACLFFEEGRGVKKDTLIERLWPDIGERQANTLFYTTVTYLRKALMNANARELLVVENQSYRLETEHITSDFQVLMDWNMRAKKGELPESQETLEVAQLYRECYMNGEDYLWLGVQREYVEQIFLQTSGKLAELEMERGEFGRAVLLLEKAVQIDVYAVSLLELLLESLIMLGEFGRAKKYFSQLQNIYENELCQKVEVKFRDYIIKAEKKRKKRSV